MIQCLKVHISFANFLTVNPLRQQMLEFMN